MKQICDFTVYGVAQPGGSKRAIPHFKGKGAARKFCGASVVEDGKHTASWRTTVSDTARANYLVDPVIGVPLFLIVSIIKPRLASHYGTGKNKATLKDRIDTFPITKPDCTKLLRSTEDALTGIIWKDDAYVAIQYVEKKFGNRPGARIRVYELPQQNAFDFASWLTQAADKLCEAGDTSGSLARP